jgi:hypothetical protein
MPREVPQVCKLKKFQKITCWTSLNVERKSTRKEWMVIEKNLTNFSLCQKKLSGFVFYKVKFK